MLLKSKKETNSNVFSKRLITIIEWDNKFDNLITLINSNLSPIIMTYECINNMIMNTSVICPVKNFSPFIFVIIDINYESHYNYAYSTIDYLKGHSY